MNTAPWEQMEEWSKKTQAFLTSVLEEVDLQPHASAVLSQAELVALQICWAALDWDPLRTLWQK